MDNADPGAGCDAVGTGVDACRGDGRGDGRGDTVGQDRPPHGMPLVAARGLVVVTAVLAAVAVAAVAMVAPRVMEGEAMHGDGFLHGAVPGRDRGGTGTYNGNVDSRAVGRGPGASILGVLVRGTCGRCVH